VGKGGGWVPPIPSLSRTPGAQLQAIISPRKNALYFPVLTLFMGPPGLPQGTPDLGWLSVGRTPLPLPLPSSCCDLCLGRRNFVSIGGCGLDGLGWCWEGFGGGQRRFVLPAPEEELPCHTPPPPRCPPGRPASPAGGGLPKATTAPDPLERPRGDGRRCGGLRRRRRRRLPPPRGLHRLPPAPGLSDGWSPLPFPLTGWRTCSIRDEDGILGGGVFMCGRVFVLVYVIRATTQEYFFWIVPLICAPI